MGSVFAEMAMSYHGKLVPVNGYAISTKIPMMIEFRLYRNAEPGETAPLWGRTAPVRFDEGGLFYIELSDTIGAAVENAVHGSLADAVAAAGGSDLWLSLKPYGYGELLPRKRLGGVYRAERAAIANRAGRVEAKRLKAYTLNAGECVIGGLLEVTNSLVSAGGTIHNTIDGTDDTSIGSSEGTVLFSDGFDCWQNRTQSISFTSGTRFRTDVLLGFGASSPYGVFSIPVQAQAPAGELPSGIFRIQQFLDSGSDPTM